MTLYSADVLDLAKPVPKKGKGKSVAATTEESKSVATEKKPISEKRLAALAKAQESRKRKREEAEAASLAAQQQEKERMEKEEEKKKLQEAKKEAQKEKRRLKKLEKENVVPTPPPTEGSCSSVDEIIDQEVKKMTEKKENVIESNSEPPVWFKQYVAGVKKEEAKISREKKPKKQIQKEAQEVAQSQWADGFTRDRVRNEVDGHMSRMYQMMFGGRRMK